jgi:hypothetical protein
MFSISRSSQRVMILVLALATLLSSWILPKQAAAQVSYSYQDQASSVKLPQHPFIIGQHMAWYEDDKQQNQQIYYQNLATGEKKQITTVASKKDSAKIGVTANGEVYLIWRDHRNFAPNQGVWDIYGYELASGREWKLNSETSMNDSLALDGSDVVWYDIFTRNIMHYDLKQSKETALGLGRSPVVADGKVVFVNATDGGLSLVTLATSVKRAILTLPYHLNVINVAFNGTYVLYKQADLDWNTKYVSLNTSDPSAKPIDLTPATKKIDEYYQLYMGDGQAAWVQDVGGTPVLKGVNLQKPVAEVHTIASGDEAMHIVAFDQDKLMMKSPTGGLLYRNIVRTETVDNASSGSPQQNTDSTPLQSVVPIQKDTFKRTMDAKGGDLQTLEGEVKLHIPPNAVKQETEMEIKLNPLFTDAIAETAARTMRSASKAWDVDLGSEVLEPIQLTFKYEKDLWTPLQSQKMILYRWNELSGKWVQAGGVHDEQNSTITADITGSGIYALFVNDITFQDSAKHWAKTYIEVLAAREIIGGMEEGKYAPEATLSRAQFTKMLVGAMGIKPATNKTTEFTDVPAAHWSVGWVKAAVSAGLVQGEGKTFKPDAELTREQMMVMLVRALQSKEKAMVLSEAEIKSELKYSDSAQISSWAKEYAAIASKSGLIQGDQGGIHPKLSSNRGQAATVVYRLLSMLHKI